MSLRTEVQSAYQFSNFIMERHSLVIEVIIEHRGDARVGEYISISLKILHVSQCQTNNWSSRKNNSKLV